MFGAADLSGASSVRFANNHRPVPIGTTLSVDATTITVWECVADSHDRNGFKTR